MKAANKPFISWDGKIGKAVDAWNRHQKWWWIGLVILMLSWFSFDVGQLVARSQLLSGSGNIQGNITIEEAIEKSENGGRLVITSESSARFIDISGSSWNIDNFGKSANQSHLDKLKQNGVVTDGSFSINIRPVKTKPNDLFLVIFTDLLFKILFIGFYGMIFFFVIKYVKSASGRFKKVNQNGSSPTVKISDVAGYEGVKQELLEVVDYLQDPTHFSKIGARPPKGVLLYGPSGTGKTLLAKAVAGQAKASFYEQSASSFIQIYAGEGAKAVRQLFEQARKTAPSVIFIDEIDAIGGSRGGNIHDERLQTLNAILTEMDGFGNNDGLVVVAATNRIDTLDEALVRPGRFDRKVLINLPVTSDREKILIRHASNIAFSEDVDWHKWAVQTKGFSGADLAALVNEAAIEAARAKDSKVTNAHITKARDRVWIGAKNHGQRLNESDRDIVAIHELGHAWMRLHTGGRIEKVSITPRGHSLGVTVNVVDDERFLHTKEDIQNELLMLMGGRAAEFIVFGKVTGGAMDDMTRASNIARDSISKLGSDKWGAYIPQTDSASIEEEAALMVNESYDKACKILEPNKDLLLKAKELMKENDELTEQELLDIWGEHIKK